MPALAHLVERRAQLASTVAPTQVKWAIASRPYSSLIRLTISIVFSLRRAAGAVGDRDERRLQRPQLGQRRVQVALAGLGLGREELEREHRAGAGPDRARISIDAHPADYAAQRSGSPGMRRTLPSGSQVGEVAEDLRQQPVRVLLGERVAVDVRHDLERRQRLARRAPRARASRRSSTSARLPWMWACTSANVRPWPGRHRRAPSPSTTSSERRNSPTGSGE